jgi:hypothetical protein
MTDLLIVLIVFGAIFVQSVSGFGLALVSMPLLALVIDLHTAAPLVALISVVAEIIILIHYREALDLRSVARFALASILGVPVGVLFLAQVDQAIVLPLLGIIVLGYALYALLGPRLPELRSVHWAHGLGFIAGVLGGAYNMPGPAVVIYANCRGWPPAQFKSNLQGFFVLTSVLILGAHVVAGHVTPDVLRDFALTLPAILLGALTGFALDRRLNPLVFRRVVQVMLIGIGLSLIL